MTGFCHEPIRVEGAVQTPGAGHLQPVGVTGAIMGGLTAGRGMAVSMHQGVDHYFPDRLWRILPVVLAAEPHDHGSPAHVAA